ncbi:MAG: spermidine synthase [Candidatus Roizmanbacteria bacterium]
MPTLKRYKSNINGEITVDINNGFPTILVDGIIQSGPQMGYLWDEAFDKLVNGKIVRSILVLGFGTGSIMASIDTHFPHCHVTGIEIDPVMIDICKEYFPTHFINATIVREDALKYVAKLAGKGRYLPRPDRFDLIIVDCYVGSHEEMGTKKLSFLKSLKRLGDCVIYNQLFISNNQKELVKISFLKDLDILFDVKALKLPHNIIIAF